MVTPSLVTSGEPVIFSRMTLRPFGPSVDLTASASWSTPALSRSRASCPNLSSLATGPPGKEIVFCAGVGRRGKHPTAAARRIARATVGGKRLSAALDLRREHVADELGGLLEIPEHDRPVIHVDHLAVVGGHVLLELGGVVVALLLAERLGDLVVDEVHPANAVDPDHRRQVGDRHVLLAVHHLGHDHPDLVVHQGHTRLARRGVVGLVGALGGLVHGHCFSSFGVSSPRSATIPAKRLLARSRLSSNRGGLASGMLHIGCMVRAASRHCGTHSVSQPCMSALLWSANSRSTVSGPKQAWVQRRSRWE